MHSHQWTSTIFFPYQIPANKLVLFIFPFGYRCASRCSVAVVPSFSFLLWSWLLCCCDSHIHFSKTIFRNFVWFKTFFLDFFENNTLLRKHLKYIYAKYSFQISTQKKLLTCYIWFFITTSCIDLWKIKWKK